MNARRALPNLLTLGNLLAGATALILLTGGAEPAAILVCLVVALACDLLDGRVARALKIDNPFGTQLDSLADLVSFGIVPAVALWQWKLAEMGPWAAPAAGALAAAAARLARFNVEAGGPGHTVRGAARSTGLPVTFPAALLIAGAAAVPDVAPSVVLAVSPLLALLMVSRLPYRTFKDRSPLRLVAFAGVCGAAAVLIASAGLLPSGERPVLPLAVALGALAYTLSAPVAVAVRLLRMQRHRAVA